VREFGGVRVCDLDSIDLGDLGCRGLAVRQGVPIRAKIFRYERQWGVGCHYVTSDSAGLSYVILEGFVHLGGGVKTLIRMRMIKNPMAQDLLTT